MYYMAYSLQFVSVHKSQRLLFCAHTTVSSELSPYALLCFRDGYSEDTLTMTKKMHSKFVYSILIFFDGLSNPLLVLVSDS